MKRLATVVIALLICCASGIGQTKAKKLICTVRSSPPITQVKPIYPPAALAKKIRGPVVLKAIIDKGGKPRQIKVKKGDPILAKAAVDAVRKWRYKPYLLNGEPVEVETLITVNFHPR